MSSPAIPEPPTDPAARASREDPEGPSQSPPAVVCFDLFGTVLHDPFRVALEKAMGMPLAEVLREKDPDSWPRFESGEWTEAQYFAGFFRPGSRLRVDPAALKRHLREGYAFTPGMEPLLARLSGRILLYALSNYSVWIEDVRRRFDLDRFFQGFYVSTYIGARKPDPRFYEAFFADVSVARSACLFVDDREENLEGARRAGMQTHLFLGAEDLERSLRALQLL